MSGLWSAIILAKPRLLAESVQLILNGSQAFRFLSLSFCQMLSSNILKLVPGALRDGLTSKPGNRGGVISALIASQSGNTRTL